VPKDAIASMRSSIVSINGADPTHPALLDGA
jgi:hypothetical protein